MDMNNTLVIYFRNCSSLKELNLSIEGLIGQEKWRKTKKIFMHYQDVT